MQEFIGTEFWAAISLLERIRCDFVNIRQRDSEVSTKPVLILPERRMKLEVALRTVEQNLRQAGLSTSGEAVSELRSTLLNWKIPGFTRMTGEEFVGRVDEIQRTLGRELRTILFMYWPQERARWYQQPRQGWEEVIARFHATVTDIEECSRCLACDRYAASVFHVMLVAEVGAVEVGKLIEIQDPKPGWPSTISEMRRIVHRMKYPDLKPVEKKHRQFLGQLLPIMESMEQGWRHKISHVENKLVLMSGEFSPLIAEEIVIATRAFMRRLATEMP